MSTWYILPVFLSGVDPLSPGSGPFPGAMAPFGGSLFGGSDPFQVLLGM